MRGFDYAALLAAQNGNWLVTRFLIFVGVTLLLTILRKVAENREKTIRANTASKTPAAPPPKKDNPFRNEIEAFLEEVGKRRATGERPGRPSGDRGMSEVVQAKTPPPPKIDSRKPVTLRPAATTDRAKSESIKTVLVPASPPARPGDDIAGRKAPGSENLGKQIRSHLAEYLDSSRMAAQTQSDLGNAVERTVRQHLGETVSVAEKDQSQSPAPEASAILPLLRNASSVRTAIVINEILGPPKGLRRR